MKDTFIIILIIVAVVIGNVISQNILKEGSEKLTQNLEELKTNLQDKEYSIKKAEQIYDIWEEIEAKWSIIIVHQELDLIKTAILSVKSGIETGDTQFCYEQIENSIFLVSHIKEKAAMEWKNIF